MIELTKGKEGIGSIKETRNHLIIAKDLGYLKRNGFEKINQEYNGLTIGLNKFIISIKNKKIT